MPILVVQGVRKWNVFFWKCYCSKTVKHIDLKWCFLDSQHYNFWYSCLTFAKKKREIRKILIWKQWKIYIIKFFWNFLKNFFRFQIAFWVDLKRKKIFEKKFWPKKIRIFFSNQKFFHFLFLFWKGKAWISKYIVLAFQKASLLANMSNSFATGTISK